MFPNDGASQISQGLPGRPARAQQFGRFQQAAGDHQHGAAGFGFNPGQVSCQVCGKLFAGRAVEQSLTGAAGLDFEAGQKPDMMQGVIHWVCFSNE
jgi:hypothetical protein